MRLRKCLAIGILSGLCGNSAWSSSNCAAQDAVWRASRPLRFSVADAAQSRSTERDNLRGRFTSDEDDWQVRADHLRRLRASLHLIRANVSFLEGRLKSYRVFRFSDGMLKPIAQTQLALEASRTAVAEIEAQIRQASRAE